MPTNGLSAAVDALPAGWHGHYFEATESTQNDARDAARRGAPSRSIFVADYQRAGRGRQGRSWLAEPGAALMLSVVFRDNTAAPVPWRWTSLASVALVEAIEDVLPMARPSIKWPNDVLLNDRKVAGILAETSWDGRQLVAIVGVGVNVSTDAAALSVVGGTPTSLREACGQSLDRGRLLLAFIRQVDRWLERPAAELHATWQARLWGRGQQLHLVDLDQDQEQERAEQVVVLGAEPDGSLRVRLADGTERLTTTGELIL
jgi:BirA family biotin operon repressor/biotin-[acetyl-CoA-carboxylase] ligase